MKRSGWGCRMWGQVALIGAIIAGAMVLLPMASRAADPQPIQPVPPPTAPTGVGAFQTSLFTGAAGYSVPIEVAPGPAGFQPKLSLAYNSSAGNGLVGQGWELAGLGYVEQLGPNPRRVPTWTSSDTYRLVLNGQSHDLVKITGGYRTKIETFWKIAASVTTDGLGGSWTVTDKGGVKYEFATAASTTCSHFRGTWYLTRVTDPNGNVITVSYDTGCSTGSAVRPTQITYGGGSVVFTWETRSDVRISYRRGAKSTMDKRLSRIDVKLGSSLVRRYNLTWTTQTSSRGIRPVSLLYRVTPYGADGTSALPPTTFTYNAVPTSSSLTQTAMTNEPDLALGNCVHLADMDGDGLPDVVRGWTGDYAYWRNLGNGSFGSQVTMTGDTSVPSVCTANPYAALADMNGDGRADVVQGWAGNWSYWPNQGNGSFGSQVNMTGDPSTNLADTYTRLIDMNGDGLPDVVYGPGYYYYWPNLGNGTFGSQVTMSNPPPYKLNAFNLRVADMNGDGLPDIVKMPTTNYSYDHVIYYPNQGTSFGTAVEMANDPHVAYDNYYRVVDANGDGTADILHGATGIYDWYANNGQGSFENNFQLTNDGSVPALSNDTVWLADMNGDGLVDIVHALTNSGGGYNYWSLSAGTAPNLLSQVDGPMGHRTTVTYTGVRNGTDLPYVQWVVSSVRTQTNAGSGGTTDWTTTYSYSGGKYVSYPDYEFRGFGTVTVTEPSDVGGPTTTTTFYQTDSLKGRVQSTVSKNSSGTAYSQTSYTYTVTQPYTGVYRVDLASESTTTSLGGTKTVTTSYSGYDSYGNPGTITATSNAGPTKTATLTYTYDLTKYIVDRVSQSIVAVGTSSFTTNNTYDANGRLTQVSGFGASPATQVSYAYDSYGNRIGVTDAKGNTCATTGYTSKTVYDSTYNTFPVTDTNALCQSVTKTYDSQGRLATVTDPNNVTTTNTYDTFSRLTAVTIPPDTSSTVAYSYSFDGTAPESTTTTRGGLATTTYYDGLGRVIQTVKPLELGTASVYTTYDSRSRVLTVSVPGDSTKKTTTAYDLLNRPTKVTNPDTTYVTTTYSGWSTSVTNERGYTTTSTTDGLGRLISVVEPTGGGTTTYAYNAADKITQITDAQGNVTTYTYDPLVGRKTAQSDPDLGAWSFTYDANGNLQTQTDAKTQTISFTYDKLNRVTTKTYPDVTQIAYTYDTGCAYCVGRLRQVTDPSGSTTFTYDERGRQTQVDKVVGTTTYTAQYTYDTLDRVVTMTYPDGEVVSHTYNAQGLLETLSSITYSLSYVSNLNYNALDKVTAKTVGNTTATTYTYNTSNFRLTGLSTPSFQNLSYTYDNIGNVTGVTDTTKAATQSFGYDNLDRLTSASSGASPTYSHSYVYNAIGNMTSGAGKSFTYPAAGSARPHAPTSDGTLAYSYDANGNLISRVESTPSGLATTRTFTWDYDNRLSQVTESGATLAEFTYDYAGARVKKVEGSTTTLTPFAHYRVVGSAVTKYYFANGQRVAERVGPNATDVYYYHPDHLGSSNVVSDSAGAEVKATLFYPYGSTRTETGTKTIAHKFTGKELDDTTGLYDYGARYYDPAFMHFITADSVIPDPADPQMLNRYAYVRNNPLKLVDPTGHAPYDAVHLPPPAQNLGSVYQSGGYPRHVQRVEPELRESVKFWTAELPIRATLFFAGIRVGLGISAGLEGTSAATQVTTGGIEAIGGAYLKSMIANAVSAPISGLAFTPKENLSDPGKLGGQIWNDVKLGVFTGLSTETGRQAAAWAAREGWGKLGQRLINYGAGSAVISPMLVERSISKGATWDQALVDLAVNRGVSLPVYLGGGLDTRDRQLIFGPMLRVINLETRELREALEKEREKK